MTYQFKITLDHSEPTVWRSVAVPVNFTFDDFHIVIQVAMGWHNAHMYQFNTGRPYGSDSIALKGEEDDGPFGFGGRYEKFDAEKMKLEDYFSTGKKKINYLYDLGDDWLHTIKLEKTLDEVSLFPKCTGGEEACPPEDCGGVGGYQHIQEILMDPKHEEYKDTREWLGLRKKEKYDEVYGFDIAEVNEMLLEVHDSK